MRRSYRDEVGGSEFAWGEIARQDHAGQVVSWRSVVICVEVHCGLRREFGCGVDMDCV